MSNAEKDLTLELDAARNVRRRARNNALQAVHAKMLSARLPEGHHLWEMLDDAYNEMRY